jgi:hypothetical protein
MNSRLLFGRIKSQFLVVTKKIWPILLVSFIGIAIGLKIVLFSDILAVGHDSVVHFYKVKLLTNQINELQNPLLWGSWDWNWYNGYPFLRVYPPLFYFLSIIPKFVLNLSEAVSMNFIVASFFPLIGISGYLIAYQITEDRIASIIGGIVYCALPSLISTITITGRLANIPAFVFAPMLIFFHNKMLREQNLGSLHFFVSTIIIPILLLSHPYTLVTLLPYLVLITLIDRVISGKLKIQSISFFPIGLLLSLFWLFPFLHYINFVGVTSPPSWSITNPTFLTQVDRIVGALGIGPNASTFFIFSIIIYIHRKKDTNILPYILCSAIALILFFLPSSLSNVEEFLLFQITSGLAPLETFTPILVAYGTSIIIRSEYLKSKFQSFAKHRVYMDREKVLVLLVILLVSLQTFCSPINPRNFSEFKPELDASRFLNEYRKSTRTESLYQTFENFSNCNSIGPWIVNGRIEVETYTEPAYLITQTENTNFTLEIDFKWKDNKDVGLGVVFGYLDENNLYQIRWLGQWQVVKLEKKIDGKWISVEPYPFGVEYLISEETWHKMKINIREKLIEIFIDNRFFFSVVDSQLIVGKIGLTVENGHGIFDNFKVYNYVENGEEEWERFWLLPRHPIMGLVSIESKMSSFDGWFDEGSPSELQYFIHRMVETEMDIINNTNATLSALRIFNTKFLIFNMGRFWLPFSGNETKIIDNLRDSSFLDLIYEKDGILIFELEETFPLMVSTNVFIIDGDELSTFYEIISDSKFDPSIGIFLSSDNNLEQNSSNQWDDNFEHNGHVNFTVNSIDARSYLKFDLTVDRDCYISLPISPYPNLKVEIDGEETEFHKVLPAFVGFQVPSGRHTIMVKPTLINIEKYSIIISTITFLSLVIYTIASIYVKNRMKNSAE